MGAAVKPMAVAMRPMVLPAILVWGGNALADYVERGDPIACWAIALTLAAVAARAAPRVGSATTLALAWGVAAFGAARFQLLTETPRAGEYRLEGNVDARRTDAEGDCLTLAVASIDGVPTAFRAKLWNRSDATALPVLPGQRVIAQARIRPYYPTGNPGEVNPGPLRRRERLTATGSFDGRMAVLASAPAPWTAWRSKQWVSLDRASRDVIASDSAASLVLAVAAGRRGLLDGEATDAFARSGLSHALSVSGLHIGVVALAAAWVFRWVMTRRIFRGLRTVDPRRVLAPFVALLAWSYVWFTGMNAPAVRAGLMVTVGIGGWIFFRRSDALNALAVAFVVMVFLDPAAPADLSVQLSFAAVASLIILSNRLLPNWNFAWPRRKWFRWILRVAFTSAAGSLAATLGTAPLVFGAFHRMSIIGVVANVIALPICAALTVCSASAVAVHAVAPALALPVLRLAGWLASMLLSVTSAAASFPWAVVEGPNPPTWIAVLWWAGLAAFALGKKSWRCLGIGAPLAAFFLFAHAPSERVVVTFLSVGQGDAVLIEAGGIAALIDGGGVPGGADTGERFILPYLRQRRISTLALVALSHAHPDHALGLSAVLRAIPVKRVLLPRDVGRGELVEELLLAAGDATVEEAELGDPPIRLANAELRILGPLGGRVASDLENDRSLVLELVHGDITFLFPGDVERFGEEVLPFEAATVVKVPHHGSLTSSTEAFVRTVHPQVAVFCVGRGNRYGFPKSEIMDRYKRVGATCYRTDSDGAVTIASDGTSIEVLTAL